MTLNEVFRQVAVLSLLGSVLAIGLWFIKLLFRRKLSPNWHYYIWLALLLRLLLKSRPGC